MVRKLVYRLFKRLNRLIDERIDDIVFRSNLVQELIRRRFQTVGSHNVIGEELDPRLVSALERLGIRIGIGALVRDLQQHLNINPQEFFVRPLLKQYCRIEAPFALAAWIDENKELVLVHHDHYNDCGDTAPPRFRQIKERVAAEQGGYLFRFPEKPLYVHIRYAKARHEELGIDDDDLDLPFGRSRKKDWEVSVRGEDAQRFLSEMVQRIDRWIGVLHHGQTLNAELEPFTLEPVRREDLVFPAALGKEIDILLKSVVQWHQNERIGRWGVFLIGPPGTGKTTLGRLLALARPEGCAFIYGHASGLRSPEAIQGFFRNANILTPTIVQIDDVDLIGGERAFHSREECTSALMDALDGIAANAKMFVILSTNDPERIDTAIVERPGRVHQKIVLEGFGVCAGELFRRYVKRYHLALAPSVIEKGITSAGRKISVFTPDSIRNVCERLAITVDGAAVTEEQLCAAITSVHAEFHLKSRRRSGGETGFSTAKRST